MADRSILLVDDDEDTCEVVSDLLAEFGYEADIAHDGREALGLAERKEYRRASTGLRRSCDCGGSQRTYTACS